METNPQTEQEIKNELYYHEQELLSFSFGNRRTVMREHVDKIKEYTNQINKLELSKIITEIKEFYDDCEPEFEKGLEKSIAIILKHVK